MLARIFAARFFAAVAPDAGNAILSFDRTGALDAAPVQIVGLPLSPVSLMVPLPGTTVSSGIDTRNKSIELAYLKSGSGSTSFYLTVARRNDNGKV
jgi:hypothetical protein